MTLPVSVLVGLSPKARRARRRRGGPRAPADALALEAEEALVSGDDAAAGARLERALQGDEGHPASLFLRAVLRQRQGNAAGADADAARLSALEPQAAEADGLRGLLRLETGDLSAAHRAFESAVAKAPEAGWPHALRSLGSSARGEWSGALSDLDRAAAAYPSPWVLSRRAFVLDRVGYFQDALRVLGRVARMMPGSAQPHLLAARIHQDQAQYARAAQRLTHALRLQPGDAELLRRRARVLMMQGRFEEAGRDLDAAAAAAPSDAGIRLERVRVLILSGRFGEAGRELRRLRGRVPADSLLVSKGILLCRSGRPAEAAPRFEKAGAGFYHVVAKILAADAPPKRRAAGSSPELLICGLGYKHPFQATVEVVRALSRCRLVYSNLSDDRVTEFLSLFPAALRSVVFRKWRSQADVCSRQVFRGLLAGGGTVGFVTRGHPLYYGRLAEKMVLRAKREGVPVRVYSSTSIADTLLSAVGSGAPAVDVVDGSLVGRRGGPALGRRPVVIYNISEPASRRRLARRLQRLFPRDRACYLLAGAGESEYAPVRFAMGDIEGPLCAADPAVTLFVPEEGGPRG